MSLPTLILPNDSHRLAVVGRTGSGKTQAAVYWLSGRSWDKKPWVVFNFKGDDLIDKIPGTFDLDVTDKAPKHPGLYIMRPLVADKDDKEKLDQFLMRCWQRENIGLYIDEGYMATGLKWFRACLTQGRSRHVPMIVLSQRPVWLDVFVWSEADFYQAFHLNRLEDQIKTAEMVPGFRGLKLPEYFSLWHDVKQGASMMLAPVPAEDAILQLYRERMPVRRRAI